MLVPILIGGGVVLASLFGLRVHAVSKQKAAAAARRAASQAPSPAAVQAAAAVQVAPKAAPKAAASPAVSAQVAAVAQKAGLSVAQFNQIAANAGTTPQAVVSSAVSSGDAVADELIRQAQLDQDLSS